MPNVERMTNAETAPRCGGGLPTPLRGRPKVSRPLHGPGDLRLREWHGQETVPQRGSSSFGLRHSFVIRHWSFVILVWASPSTTSAACACWMISSVLAGSTARQAAVRRSDKSRSHHCHEVADPSDAVT